MQVMVTGGAGFIGSNLVDRLLAEGHSVDVVDDLSTGSLGNLADARASASHALTFHQLDVRSDELVEVMARRRPEVVFHLAAQADVRVSVERPVFDADVNILGTLRVLEGARAAGTARVAFAASGGTLYGECDPSELPVKESHPRRPLSPYGVSKMAAIDYLVAYRELHALEFCALALANVYGPRQDPHGEAGVVAIFSDKLLRGESGHDLRRRRADARLRLRRRRRRRLRPCRHAWRRSRPQHRDRERGVGERARPCHGRARRDRPPPRSMPRPGPERSSAAPSTPSAPASTWDGGRGPSSRQAWTACSSRQAPSRLLSRLLRAERQRKRSSAGGRRISSATDPRREPGRVDAAHHRHGDRARLAHDELGRRRHLVGHAHLGRHQVSSHGVRGAPEVDHRGDARAADGHVDDALAPGPAEGVGDHDRHLAPRDGAQAVADATGRAIRVLGEQGRPPVLDVGQVDAGIGADEPVACLGDHEVAAAPQDAHGLRLDDAEPVGGVVGIDPHHATLGLGDDLLGDDDHVAMARSTAAAMRAARSSPGRISPRPVTGSTVKAPGGCASGSSTLTGRPPACGARRRGRVEQHRRQPGGDLRGCA